MPKPKRLPSDVLRDALAALAELKREMPQSIVLIGQCERQVTHVIEAYEEQRRTLDELRESTRKPPQRVMMRARKKPVRVVLTDRTNPVAPLDSMHRTRDTFESVDDYDMEEAKELEDRFGHDIPDGSD